MPRDRDHAVISVGTAACLLFAAVASAIVDTHGEAPAYALSSSAVFYLERFLATRRNSVRRSVACAAMNRSSVILVSFADSARPAFLKSGMVSRSIVAIDHEAFSPMTA